MLQQEERLSLCLGRSGQGSQSRQPEHPLMSAYKGTVTLQNVYLDDQTEKIKV